MWFQLKIENCPNFEVEQISEELEETGALSVMITDKNDDPVLEPAPGATPLWPEIIIHALYANAEEAQCAREQLSQQLPALIFSIEVLADKDWEREWMNDFKPQRFGQRLWICPSWLAPPDPQAINLMLDPGLAFGTGTHATTSLCLTWLDQAELNQKVLIDYGCGSGILSLSALKLGAQHVYAVDIDPQALEATKNNADNNHITENALTICTPEMLEQPADVLIANILLEPLISLQHRFGELLKQDGLLVVSGILTEQVAALTDAYKSEFKLLAEQHHEGWSLLVLSKQ